MPRSPWDFVGGEGGPGWEAGEEGQHLQSPSPQQRFLPGAPRGQGWWVGGRKGGGRRGSPARYKLDC